jgi:phage-related protein
MARAQSQFLRIFDAVNLVHVRWQNYYNQVVTWDSQQWQPMPFMAEGLTEGVNGQESDIDVTIPAGTSAMRIVEQSILQGRLAELTVYQFDTILGNATPQTGQQLVTQYTGQIVSGGGELTSITMRIGAALTPIGAQVPPRKFTTAIMGQGCRL